MHQRFRFAAAIILFLSIIFLARNQVAGAVSAPSPSISAREQKSDSVLLAPPEGCKDKKNKEKCKGTVKPPPFNIVIPVTGDYSLGGFCTLSVNLTDAEVNLQANLLAPLPGELPQNVHKVEQGCLLTYNRAGQLLNQLPAEAGSTTICFAAGPNQEMTVYFYNLYSGNPTWTALETTVEAGIACAPANESGVYIATFTT
jgi:hypothetical protein